VIVRSTSPRINLAGLNVELVTGDLTDPHAVAAAIQDVDALYHVAADYRIWARDPQEIVRNNLATTRTVMDAARTANVARIVYTSSVATLKPTDDGTPVDEHAVASPDEAIGAYKRSKVLAERLVEEMVATLGLPAVIVNPSTPIGPHDVRPTPTGRIIVEAAMGKIPAFVNTGLNLVHVDDVAAGHLAAFDRGCIGQRYVLGGQDATLAAFLSEVAKQVGRKPPKFALPYAPLYPLAYCTEALAQLTHREPMLSVDALRMARHTMYFSSRKAELELGYRARPYVEAVSDAISWFRQQGRI
jgi:dihydroflavonol-4-reductase